MQQANIPYFRPTLGVEEEQAVLGVLRSGWLTTGNEVAHFEQEFSAFLADRGEFHAIAVSSATAGLHIGIKSLAYMPKQSIALSPYTFAASINSILYNDLTPLLLDTVPGGYHLDPDRLADALKQYRFRKRLRAVMPVHIAGFEYGGAELADLCGRYGLDMIEDAAHSFPAKNAADGYQGTRGRLAAFSFYANKTLVTGEGGMIVTRDDELLDRLHTLRSHGLNKGAWLRHNRSLSQNAVASSASPGQPNPSLLPQGPAGGLYDIVDLGYKYNMPDILACIGRVQLRRARQMMANRRSVAERYLRAFADRDWCSPPPGADCARLGLDNHSWHIYSLRLNLDRLSIDRDHFMQEMLKAGISSSIHFIPLHLMSLYKTRWKLRAEDFPNALATYLATISLPIFPGLTEEEVARIIATVLDIGDRHYRSH